MPSAALTAGRSGTFPKLNPPESVTFHIQTFEGEQPEAVNPERWKPWINCDSQEETARLAAHRHILNRGGVLPGEKLTLHVLTFKEGQATHKNGNPMLPTLTTFEISKP